MIDKCSNELLPVLKLDHLRVPLENDNWRNNVAIVEADSVPTWNDGAIDEGACSIERGPQ